MDKINPTYFYGPRSYFTDFDYKIIMFKNNKKAYRKEVEHRLKILLLTKSFVVCAASHLANEFTYDIFKDNPILLTEDLVLPALRNDKECITEYLKGKRIKKHLKEEMRYFYEENVKTVVEWELMENASWLRKNILNELNNNNSVIRRNLINLPNEKLNALILVLEKNDILSRELVLKNISTWSLSEQKVFLNFVNLIYHMSGARVVNCESALPQESYIDYSLTDFSNHRSMLSETQVFSKIFLELAFESIHRNPFPIELLDILSFEDIYYVKRPLENSSFYRKYDELIQISTQAMRNSGTGLESFRYDIEKPLEILGDISKTFEEVFAQQLPEFQKKRHKKTTKGLRKSTLSLGIGVAGLFPLVSNIADLLILPSATREFFINLNQWFRSRKEVDDYSLYLRNKEKTLHQMIENYPITEKTIFLDVLDLLTETTTAKLEL